MERLEGEDDLKEEERSKIHDVCIPWDLPGVTPENRRWLKDKILVHAVLGRITKQVRQLKKGLKDTGVWELISSRPDAVEVIFPRSDQERLSPQMVLDKIIWPTDEDAVPIEDQNRAAYFLRQFILASSSDDLKCLVCFWTGWDVLPDKLYVEVHEISLPQASTCFYTLKLPGGIDNMSDFQKALNGSISTSYAGFGQY